jgi:hypothetical protein
MPAYNIGAMEIRYDITAADHLEMVKAVHAKLGPRLLKIAICGATILFVFLAFPNSDSGFKIISAAVLGSLAFVQLTIPYIIHRRVYFRNPRLFATRTVLLNEDGLVSDSDLAHTEIKWNLFEGFKETENLFLTFQGRHVVGIIPKRAFPEEKLKEFRDLLRSKIPQNVNFR